MDTITIQMDISKDLLLAADISETNAQSDIKKYLALYLFKELILSFGKAADLSGMDKLSFLELVGIKGIQLNYDSDDYYDDIKTIKGFEL